MMCGLNLYGKIFGGDNGIIYCWVVVGKWARILDLKF
jgi:hypothetical protein